MFSRSVMSDSATPWAAARQASLSITNSGSLLKFMSIESVMPSNLSPTHLQFLTDLLPHAQALFAKGKILLLLFQERKFKLKAVLGEEHSKQRRGKQDHENHGTFIESWRDKAVNDFCSVGEPVL